MVRRIGRNEPSGPDKLVAVGVERDGSLAIVRVRGELDLALAPRVSRAIERLRLSAVRDVVVDLSEVGFVDSAGMRVLVQATKDLSSTGSTLRVRSATPAVFRRLSLTGLDRVLSFEGGASADQH